MPGLWPGNPSHTLGGCLAGRFASVIAFTFKISYVSVMIQLLARTTVVFLALLGAGQAFALELVFFTRPGCPYCLKWEKDVAPIYSKSEEARRAPLRRWDLSEGTPPDKLAYPVRYTPTFVLVERGVEIGRITGYINDDMFWGVLGKMLKDLPADTSPTRPAPAEKQ